MDNFDPRSSDIREARIVRANFDGLTMHLDVWGGRGTMVDQEGLTRPCSDLVATLSVRFALPEEGATATILAQSWAKHDSLVRVQTYEDGSVKVTSADGSSIQGDCLTS